MDDAKFSTGKDNQNADIWGAYQDGNDLTMLTATEAPNGA